MQLLHSCLHLQHHLQQQQQQQQQQQGVYELKPMIAAPVTEELQKQPNTGGCPERASC
jgi:hypothetical protein